MNRLFGPIPRMKQVLQAQPLAFLHENVPSFPIGELERILGGVL